MKKKPSFILQELDSDDELPDNYNDASILPAYLDDRRFDEITFPWMNNINLNYEDISPKPYLLKSQRPDKLLRQDGILKGQDLYCLKSVESFTCTGTLLWFVNFLLRKDLQSHYNYLKSCLVDNVVSSIPFNKNYNNESKEDVINNRFEIVVKA